MGYLWKNKEVFANARTSIRQREKERMRKQKDFTVFSLRQIQIQQEREEDKRKIHARYSVRNTIHPEHSGKRHSLPRSVLV